jgi:hypothetical protein
MCDTRQLEECVSTIVSSFREKKDGKVEPVCEQFHKWQKAGIPLTKVRCDNAGENTTLEARSQSKDWKLNLEFEYTARDTPQQNSLAETSKANMANHGRALMNAGLQGIEIQDLEGGI